MNVFVNNNSRVNFFDDETNPDHEKRKDLAYNFFKDKWFITTPSFNYNSETERMYVVAYDVEVMTQNENVDTRMTQLIRVPMFEFSREYNRPRNENEFEDALIKGKIVGNLAPWPASDDEAPEAVIWRRDDVTMDIFFGIDQQHKSDRGFSFTPKPGAQFQKTTVTIEDADWLENLIHLHNEDIAYIPSDIFDKYARRATDVVGVSESTAVEPVSSKPAQASIVVTAAPAKPAISNQVFGTDNSKQAKFMRQFINQTRLMNLHFDVTDLINFHTAMESRGLVILSGLSGTGKSKLVTAYARTLGLVDHTDSNSGRLCFVPVRPFWADDSDLLGYADMVNSV